MLFLKKKGAWYGFGNQWWTWSWLEMGNGSLEGNGYQLIQLTVPVLVEGQVGLKKGEDWGVFSNLKSQSMPQFSPVFWGGSGDQFQLGFGNQGIWIVDLGRLTDAWCTPMQIWIWAALVGKEIRKMEWAESDRKVHCFLKRLLVDWPGHRFGKPFSKGTGRGWQTAFSIQPQEVHSESFFWCDQNFNLCAGLEGKVISSRPSRRLRGLSNSLKFDSKWKF